MALVHMYEPCLRDVIYIQLQSMWKDFVKNTYACCSPAFWSVYKAVHGQTATCIDAVLHAVKNLVEVPGRWPQSNRALLRLITKHSGNFWSNVVYTKKIDLDTYQLPGCASVTFRYVDPVFMWIQRCNSLCEAGISLEWKPKKLRHPHTDEEVYGAGIEYSLLMRNSTAEIPVNGNVALFNISWDGGDVGYGHRSAVPVVVQVMNTNSMSPLAVGLLGYLPFVEVAEGCKSTTAYANAKKHVLQVKCLSTHHFVCRRALASSFYTIINCLSTHHFVCRRALASFLYTIINFLSTHHFVCRRALASFLRKSKAGHVTGSTALSVERKCCCFHVWVR